MIKLESHGDIALLRMDDGKANAMNPEFFAGLNRALDAAGEASALVLVGARNFFSGGLDLPYLASQPRPEIEHAYEALHGTMMRLFLLPAPVVAAVNGHAIAGGCILAFQADALVMSRGEFKFGLNEARLGLPLPAFVVETFRERVSPRVLQRMTLEGPLFSPDEALAAGLIDEICEPKETESRATARAEELAHIPRAAFAESKRLLREPASRRAERARADEARRWIDLWFSPPAQLQIGEIVARLNPPKR
jgi:enoyl-CoA hydratase